MWLFAMILKCCVLSVSVVLPLDNGLVLACAIKPQFVFYGFGLHGCMLFTQFCVLSLVGTLRFGNVHDSYWHGALVHGRHSVDDAWC